jgi:hypothetical protein
MSKIKVNSIEAATGTTVTLPSGQTLDLSSGTVTLPNSSVNLTTKVTGTLPVANGGTGLTTLGTAAQVLRVNSGATALEYATAAAGGKVLQVVSVTDNNERSTSSTSYVTATGYDLNITPAATNSKIFLIVSSGRAFSDAGNCSYSFFRDATNLGDASHGFQVMNDSQHRQIISTFLDSPNTTSAINYTVKFKTDSGGSTAYFNTGTSPTRGGASSPAPGKGVFTAIEIGA